MQHSKALKLLVSSFLLTAFTQVTSASELVVGKVCSPQVIDSAAPTPTWVPQNRKYFAQSEKLIHQFASNCLFFKVHPLKVELTQTFFLGSANGDLSETEIQAFQTQLSELFAVETQSFNTIDVVDNAELMVKSLYGDVQLEKTASGFTVTAPRQTLLSVEGLLKL